MNTTQTRLAITGLSARELRSHVLTYVKPGKTWQEVQTMNECRHGCKLYARQSGAVLQWQIWHSASYGCALGRHDDTRTVPVSVRIHG